MKSAVSNMRLLSTAALHTHFLAILPRIEQHGRICFRHERCASKKADHIAEMIALAWKWYVGLMRRGKDPSTFVSTFADFAAKAVKSGRRLCGHENPKDVLSGRAQQMHNFTVGKLPSFSTMMGTELTEALIDNTLTPPDEQAAFRIDFPVWIHTHSQRHRKLLQDLMHGHQTKDLASKYGMSPGRISQLRREFRDDWDSFCGEPDLSAA